MAQYDAILFRQKIGKLLLAERTKKDISRYVASNRATVGSTVLTATQIKDIEEGGKAYTIDSLYKYCQATKINLSEVLKKVK